MHYCGLRLHMVAPCLISSLPRLTLHLYSHFCSYLLPHLLPPKPAMDIHGFRQHTSNAIQRHFKMSFVPAGFWERFIARMLISLNQMDLQVHRAYCLISI